MALISKKKIPVPISETLREFLVKYNRYLEIPIHYRDLRRFEDSIPLYDHRGDDTLWQTVMYYQDDMVSIHYRLKQIYAILKANGDMSVMEHLYVDRVDVCTYGNTQPFRIRIVNQINDNFDYFYIKHADASRVYGLELEDMLSPNHVNYLVHGQTLIEEHIAGIPGDMFMQRHLPTDYLNKIRIAKEFVKFNERCFVRLLGDMHSSNFVVDVTPDFEEVHYRIRAIDFDQQCYEGKRNVYMPQYFKQNNPIIRVGLEVMTPESMRQYQKEERTLLANRARASQYALRHLLRCMKADALSTPDRVELLRQELAEFHKDARFLPCRNMGEVLEASLLRLF
jgi:hypothetical protein